MHTEPASDGGVDEIALAAPATHGTCACRCSSAPVQLGPGRAALVRVLPLRRRGARDAERPAVVVAGAATVAAGAAATVPVVLNAPAADETPRPRDLPGGTAVAGTDYTAVDEVLTFAPGETTQGGHRRDGRPRPARPVTTFDLTLSDPTASCSVPGRPPR